MSSLPPIPATPRRPHTHRGLPSDRPPAVYEPTDTVQHTPAGFEVTMLAEDGRSRTFKLKTLPLPGWHQAVAIAFARITGPQGNLRTTGSATTSFWAFKRFLMGL